MEKPRLIKWADDGYPPIDLNNEFKAIIELIRAYKELEKQINNHGDKRITKDRTTN